MHQNEWFQVWFFKNFLGRGSPSPLPRPLPPLFLGLRPRYGLRPQFSGASRPRLGLRPQLSIGARPWFGSPKINSWIRPCTRLICSGESNPSKVGSCWLSGARSTLFADLHLLLQFALLLQNSEGPSSVRLYYKNQGCSNCSIFGLVNILCTALHNLLTGNSFSLLPFSPPFYVLSHGVNLQFITFIN